MLNTRHSVRSVPGRSVVVYEVARGFSGGQEFATSINVANEDSVTGVTELGVQPAKAVPDGEHIRRSDTFVFHPPARTKTGECAPIIACVNAEEAQQFCLGYVNTSRHLTQKKPPCCGGYPGCGCPP